MHKLRQKWLTGCIAVTLALAPIVNFPIEAFATTSVESVKVAVFSPSTQRLAGNDRYGTAEQIAQEGWKTSSDYAVLTAGMDENLVDALAAAPLAKLHNAPILLTEGNVLNSKAEAEIKRLGVKTVYVTTGPAVIKQAVTDRLTELGVKTITMLGGSDRFATAVNIAKEIALVKPFTQIAVTTAWKNADALSVASFAAAKGFPILLSDVNSIPQGTADYINSVRDSISDTYVLGSATVIGQSVENSLPKPTRVGGSDRYATNREILKIFASDIVHGKVYVASGEDNHLVDALSVSPLAGQYLAPVVLTGQTMPTETTDFAKLNLLPNQIIALGGESAVPEQSLQALTTLITYADSSVTKGSADAAAPETIADTLKISGNNVTLQNAKVLNSIYVQGDKVTLKNLNVTGTIFLDPGPTGTSDLDNVNAGRIVVLSGAKNSHRLKNVKTAALKIDSESRVETSGATSVVNTSVSAAAILDNVGGSFGKVEVNKGINEIATNKNIEFRGVFDQPIVVKAPATIKAAENASIAKVEVATQYKDDNVTLEGKYNTVEVVKEGNLYVAANAKINAQIIVDASANIKADPTSSVAKIDISTTINNAKVSVEGTSIQLVSVSSVARVVLPDGTKVKLTVNTAGVTIDAGKNTVVTMDSKSFSVETVGEGKSNITTANLDKIVEAVKTIIEANTKALEAQMTAAHEANIAAQDQLDLKILKETAPENQAAIDALEEKVADSQQAAEDAAEQATTITQEANQTTADASKDIEDASDDNAGGGGDGGGDTSGGIALTGGAITKGSVLSADGIIAISGSTVTISGTTSTLKEVHIKVLKPSDSSFVYTNVVEVNSNNQFSVSFLMPSNSATGNYSVVVGLGTEVVTGTLKVS